MLNFNINSVPPPCYKPKIILFAIVMFGSDELVGRFAKHFESFILGGQRVLKVLVPLLKSFHVIQR